MPLVPERTFNPTMPVIVRRFFVAAGRHFNPGDVFDWKRLSVDQRRVRLLFEAGKLMHSPATAQVNVPTSPVQLAESVSDLAGLQAFESITLVATGEIGIPEPEVADGDVLDIFTSPTPTVEQEMADEDILRAAAGDGLDDLNMKELRAIAEAEGAPYRVSRDAQREAIREHRRGP